MIKKHYLMPLFAALALTACSEKESGDEPVNGSDDFGYVAVKIVQPKDVQGRASSAPYEDGTDDENFAEKATFYLFNEDGTLHDSVVKDLVKEDGETPNGVEAIYSAVLVVNENGVATKPQQKTIVCVLNTTPGAVSNLTDFTADKMNQDYGTTGAKGTFVMTNAVTKNGSTTVYGGKIEADNLKQTPESAMLEPVEIYVERVVAQIRVKSESFNNKGANPIIDGAATPLTIDVTGIEIANIAKKAYLLKNVDGITYDWAWGTNRSWWETVSLTPQADYGNKSYNQIATTGFNINTLTGFKEYVQPNTSAQKTSVLVTAQLKYADGDNAGQPITNLVYLKKAYQKESTALTTIAHGVTTALGKYYVEAPAAEGEAAHYRTIDESDFGWCNASDLTEADKSKLPALESYEVAARLKPGTKLYTTTDNVNFTEVADAETTINTLLWNANKEYVGRKFTDGKCYYFVEIDQSPVAGAANGTYLGVVRNHIYDLTLNSIEGLGTPIYKPEEVIIPERPEDEESLWYLAARVKVLAWRLVSQTVDFTGNK